MNGSKIVTWLIIAFLCLLVIGVADVALSLVSGILSLLVSFMAGILHLAFSKAGLTLILIGLVVYIVTRNSKPERYRFH